jgi:Derlin-2/3
MRALPRRSFRYGVQLETNVYAGRGADYAWFLLSTMAILLASTALLPAVLLGPSLIMALVYVWSRANATARVSFFGLFAVEGFYLPFALLAWTLLSGGDAIADVRGILAGHVYYFLSSVWPRQGGPKLLETPQVVRAATAWAFGGAYAAPPTQRGAPPPPRGGVFQGRGRRLNE